MNDIETIKKILTRYRNVIILDDPIPFNELMSDRNFDCVQVHSLYDENTIGFCGQFEWKNNALKPLDGDSYNECMKVVAYEEAEDGVLDIIAGYDW